MRPRASIIDKPKPFLEPRLWDKNNLLHFFVKDKILAFVNKVLLPFSARDKWLEDIVIGGSFTTNQYNPESDLDIAILINFEEFCRYNLWCRDTSQAYSVIKKRMDLLARNLREINGVPVRFFLSRKGKEYPSPGLYSVLCDKWIREPFFFPLELDPDELFAIFKKFANIIAYFLRSADPDLRHLIWREIERQRQLENFRRGDFNELNIIYKYLEKILRRQGYV